MYFSGSIMSPSYSDPPHLPWEVRLKSARGRSHLKPHFYPPNRIFGGFRDPPRDPPFLALFWGFFRVFGGFGSRTPIFGGVTPGFSPFLGGFRGFGTRDPPHPESGFSRGVENGGFRKKRKCRPRPRRMFAPGKIINGQILERF